MPTVHRSETQRQAAEQPPDAAELKSAMDVATGPAPFEGAVDQRMRGANTGTELTTGGVVNVTSPTFAAQMAGSTLLMVGVLIVLLVVGVTLIVLALKF